MPQEDSAVRSGFSLLRKVIQILVYVDDEENSDDDGESRARRHARSHHLGRGRIGDVHEPVILEHDFRVLRDEEIIRRRQHYRSEVRRHDAEIRPFFPFEHPVSNAGVQDSNHDVERRRGRSCVGSRTDLRPNRSGRMPEPKHEDAASDGNDREDEHGFESERHGVVVIRIIVEIVSFHGEQIREEDQVDYRDEREECQPRARSDIA